MNDIKPMNDELFSDIVGQEQPKKELKFYLNSYLHTQMVPHLGIIAPRGQGKTRMARAIAKGLWQFDDEGGIVRGPSRIDPNKIVPKRKPFVEINCSTIKNVKGFFNSIILKWVQDKDVTLFFDEASEIPPDVSMALLTILEPNSTHRTQFQLDEYVADFDFRRQSFIFATTEPQKVFHALMDRLERITLQEYTSQNLADIVQMHAPQVKFTEGLLLELSSVLRGNARAAFHMANKIQTYLNGGMVFTHSDWSKLKDTLSIKPLGLNAAEINVLRHLAQNPNGTSLTALSAKTGLTREALRLDVEMYLLKHSLMSIGTGGRVITPSGLDYLKILDHK